MTVIIEQSPAGEPTGSRREVRALALAGLAVTRATEVSAALLVVVEIVVLLAGVISRYVFHRPFTWTDELAHDLFLWLGMLGAVIALRRGEHMRLTTFVNAMGAGGRAWLDTFATVCVGVFAAAMIGPSQAFVVEQNLILTPALQIHDSLRVAAMFVGIVLMLVTVLLRLARESTLRHTVLALAVVAGVAIVVWLLSPALVAVGNLNLLFFFVLLLGVLVAAGVPIAFAFAGATLAYVLAIAGVPLSVLVSQMDEGMSNPVLLAIPLFVLLGFLMEMTGIAKVLIDFLSALLGHVRGGLNYVLLGAMFLISGISGSKAADMAAVAPVLFPEMRRRGSKPGELIALLSASGAMAETIPPSLVLIIIGSVTGVSIAALFTGGLLPAAVAALALVLVAYLRSRGDDVSRAQRPAVGRIVRTFVVAIPGLALPLLIRAAVLGGVATATEVSTIGIVYTAGVGLLVYRRFAWRRVYPMLVETASLSGAILLIIGAATAMAWALTQSGFSQDLVSLMTAVPGGKAGFLAISIVVFAILGSVLEGIPVIVLFGPLLFPVARGLHMNEVHYAIVVILAMGIGLFAPPFGVGFYSACAIGRVSPDEAIGRMAPYLAALVIATVAVAAIPWLSIGFLGAPR